MPNPILLEAGLSFNENIDLLYTYFRENIMDKRRRNKLFDKFIYVDCNNWIDRKSELFWHLVSLHEKEKFNILPCNNCQSSTFCPNINCLNSGKSIKLSNNQKRNICLYRGIRISWINKIIELANQDDEDIMLWKENVNGKKLNKKVYIRFKHQGADYIVLLEERYRRGEVHDYYFITAFPVFYINKKDTFDQKYLDYVKNMQLAN